MDLILLGNGNVTDFVVANNISEYVVITKVDQVRNAGTHDTIHFAPGAVDNELYVEVTTTAAACGIMREWYG